MRICISAFLMTHEPGKKLTGVGRHMIQTLDALTKIDFGHHYEVFVSNKTELPDSLKQCPWMTFHAVDVSTVLKRTWWEHFKVGIVAKRLKCDLLHSLFVNIPLIRPLPVTAIAHDAFPRTHPEWFPLRNRIILDTLSSHACRKSKRVITVSEYSKSELIRVFKIKKENIHISYPGPGNRMEIISESVLKTSDLSQYTGGTKRFIFIVSTVEPRKNMKRLIEGFLAVKRDAGNEDLCLLIAGAKGWLQSDLASVASDSEYSDSIKFLGYVPDDDLNLLMQSAQLTAMVSLEEGFGAPVLEAMSVGCPVVVSDCSSLPEVAGECAFYCDPYSVDSIAEAMKDALVNRDKAIELARKGLERANTFTWEASVIGLNKMWLEVNQI
jgi:glycosyltransferase involved in cell wall biosynthesis